jgi:predicted RNA-binding Zn-ribbon protein involved in translation (DUF1610 family)
MALFGSSFAEREHVVTTIRSLGTTSVAGLAAALSISERRAVKLLRETFRHGPRGLVWDVSTRTVSFGMRGVDRSAGYSVAAAPAEFPVESLEQGMPRSPPPMAAIPSLVAQVPSPPVPAVLRSSTHTSRLRPTTCVRCKVGMVATEVEGQYCCPQCGRFDHGAAAPTGSSAPVDGGTPPTRPAPDQRTQEMFAAWAIGKPIPCPQCRQPLRHHGVGAYRCPTCGREIAFSAKGATMRNA